MRAQSAILILSSVLLSAGSQILLKRGMTGLDMQAAIKTGGVTEIALAVSTSPSVLLGLGCFGLSLSLWLFILSYTPLSSAYPFVSLGIIVTVFAGALLFAEPISLTQSLGVGLIVGGVILVGIAG